MIELETACRIATEEMDEPFVSSIIDIGKSYVISTLSKDGESADVMPLLINKGTGMVDVCFYPTYHKQIEKGTELEIPSKYQYRKGAD